MPFKSFIPYLKPFKKQAILAPLFMMIVVLADLIQPYLTQQIIDKGIASGDIRYVVTVGLIMVAVALIGFVAGLINIVLSAKAAIGSSTLLRKDLFKKIQTLSFSDIDRLTTGNLIVRLTNDVNQVQNFALQIFRILVRAPLTAIGSLIMAFITSTLLSPIIIILSILIIMVLVFILKRSMNLFVQSQQALDQLNRNLNENLNGIRTVKVFTQEEFEIDKFSVNTATLANRTVLSSRAVATILPLLMLILNLGIVAVLWFGGAYYATGQIELGQIVSFTNYLILLMLSLVLAGMVLMSVTRAMVSAKRINEVFDTQPEINDTPNAITLSHVEGNLRFEHVYFSYDDSNNWVLKDINFTATKGEVVGIIGATGSGKSTLVQLIPRFYDADIGRILIDGHNVKNIKESSLRDHISIVLQKAMLFSGTIKENIKYGNQAAQEEDVIDAARTAQAQEFIDRFTEKYDTLLYQKGSNLSGGQRQRVSIARGLIKKPSILILDDSTSALDAKSESLVKNALSKKFSQTTTILIAQKISSVIDADKILVLEHGEIVGEGTHQQLLETHPVYQAIYQSQIGKEA